MENGEGARTPSDDSKPVSSENILEGEHRNRVQIVIALRQAKNKEDRNEVGRILFENSEIIGNILDADENTDIRELARAGNYEEAANLVLKMFNVPKRGRVA